MENLGFPDVTIQLSPDGFNLAYALSGGSVTIASTAHGSALVNVGDGFLPIWSAQGDKLAFYSTSSGDVQLWVYDVHARHATQVTYIIGGIDPDPSTRVGGWVHDAFRYGWSPDGTRLVFATRIPVEQGHMGPTIPESSDTSAPLILTNNTPPDWTLSGIFARPTGAVGTIASADGHSITSRRNDKPGTVLSNQLFVVNLNTHAIRRVTYDSRNYFNPQWSPKGDSIVCAAGGTPGSLYGAAGTAIYTIDPATGVPTAITDDAAVRSRPSWAADGRYVAFFQSKTYYSQRAVFVVAPKQGVPHSISASLDRQIMDFLWLPDGQEILITFKDGVSVVLGAIRVRSGAIRVIPGGLVGGQPVVIGFPTASRKGDLAWTQETPQFPRTLQFLGAGSREARQAVDLAPNLHGKMLGAVRVIHWRNQRGEQLEGSLLFPPNFEVGRRYPLIVDAYPFVDGADWMIPMLGNQAWAASGYLVFRPSPRAPHVWMNPWKSEEWSLSAKGPEGWNIAFEDVMSGVDELVRRRVADENRMCIYGFSNGGGIVNYIVTTTHRFRCAVAVAGAMLDWVRPTLLNTGYDKFLGEWAGASIWRDPAIFVGLSPVFRASRNTTPILLADGDNDGEFLLDNVEMYNGFRSAGVQVTFLRYPNQGHGFTGSALHDFWNREMEYFHRYLNDP
jgi:dipeptidyl aminopeptidase/acylaminoacyl peptidase